MGADRPAGATKLRQPGLVSTKNLVRRPLPTFAKMNDPALRALLYPRLQGGVYVDELPTGSTRADVVHITAGFMHGYELKGDGDTLLRVPRQLDCYGRVYDFVSFVVTEKHLPALLPLLPEWVGVLVAAGEELREHRPARYNAQVERAPLAGLLLLEDVKQFLLSLGLVGVSTLRGAEVRQLLRQGHGIPLARLAQFVRDRLMTTLPGRLLARAERKAERAQRPKRVVKKKAKKRKAAGARKAPRLV